MSLTHLQAFMSDDAKRGREWINSHGIRFRRTAGKAGAESFYDIETSCVLRGPKVEWGPWRPMTSALLNTVTWADEPKTLTPQEALRALADGKCIACNTTPYRLGKLGMEYWSPTQRWVTNDFMFGEVTGKTWRECPDPSQPAEPPEQQAEYPLTFEQAYVEMQCNDRIASNDLYETMRYRYASTCGWFEYIDSNIPADEWEPFLPFSNLGFKKAKWRIVEGK